MKIIHKVYMLILTTLFLVCSTSLMSQTLNEAGEHFNSAIKMAVENPEAALESYNKCIKMCNEIGPEADELKGKAESQLPGLHFRIALNLYKEKKTDESIIAFKNTLEICEKYKDENTKVKTIKSLGTAYTARGYNEYKSKEYDQAIEDFNSAVELDSNNIKALFYKGNTFRKQKRSEEMVANMEQVIEVGKPDSKYVLNAKKVLAGHYAISGGKEIKKKAYTKALDLLNKAKTYSEKSVTTHYYFAVVYNIQKKWDKAIEHANIAIENEKDDVNKKARIYYELGTAYKGKGSNEEACKAYKNASFGKYKESSQQIMKDVLKCK